MKTIANSISGDKIYIKWIPIEPTEEILKRFNSVFNDPYFFWKHFSEFVPQTICLNKVKEPENAMYPIAAESEIRSSEFVIWQHHDESNWPYETFCQILDDELKYAVYWIRDMRTGCGYHGYMGITDFSCEEPPR